MSGKKSCNCEFLTFLKPNPFSLFSHSTRLQIFLPMFEFSFCHFLQLEVSHQFQLFFSVPGQLTPEKSEKIFQSNIIVTMISSVFGIVIQTNLRPKTFCKANQSGKQMGSTQFLKSDCGKDPSQEALGLFVSTPKILHVCCTKHCSLAYTKPAKKRYLINI